MSMSSRLSLPYILPQQAQKHVTVNEAVRRLDALVQLSVASRTTTAEPASPVEGRQYILPSGKTGANWGAMAAGAITAFQDGAWTMISPKEGFCAYVEDTNTIVVHDGAGWIALGALLGLGDAAAQAYEEGAFTPTVTGSVSDPTIAYSARLGAYTRVGRMVFAEIGLVISSVSGGSGDVRVSLPFTAAASPATFPGAFVYYSVAWAANKNPTATAAQPGFAHALFYTGAGSDWRAGSLGTRLQVGDLAAGANLYCTVIYRV